MFKIIMLLGHLTPELWFQPYNTDFEYTVCLFFLHSLLGQASLKLPILRSLLEH